MTWMNLAAGGFPLYLDHAQRGPGHRPRRPRVRRLRARRHRRHGRPLAARHRRGDRPPERPRHHGDDADRGRRLGGGGARAPLRPAAVVVHAHGHRRQPLGDPARPPGHEPPQDPRLRLVLPRQRRRGVRAPRPERRRGAAGQRRPAGRRWPQTTRVAEFNDAEQLERRARPRRRRRRPDGAGADQHRHRAAGAGLPGDGEDASRASTARCSSTTRRTPSAPARAAPRAPGTWTRTSSRSARRSPAACPPAPSGSRTELAERIAADRDADLVDTGGVGGTLAGNALSLAATRATLEHVLTDDAFARHDRPRHPLRGRRAGGDRRARPARGRWPRSAPASSTASPRRRRARAAKRPPPTTASSRTSCTSIWPIAA